MKFKENAGATSRPESGFSLLELMISLALFLIVTGAIFSVLSVARQSRSFVSENTGLNKNIRIALNMIGRDAYNAGYGYPLRNTVVLPDDRVSLLLGIPSDVDTTRDVVPPIVSGNDVTLNTFNTAPDIRTDQVTFLYKDPTFNLIGAAGSEVSTPLPINAATTTSGIDEIIPLSGSNSACRVNDLYLVTGNTGSTLGVSTALFGTNTVRFANGDPLGFNLTGTSGPLRAITTPATLQRVQMVTYFVTADGTLTRRRYANVLPVAAFTDEPLIYGVENFQIKYVMDDGSLSDNPSAGPDGIPGTVDDTQANLAAVRQIRVTVYVRSVDRTVSGVPFRSSMTATFSTRNLGYDAN
ncbi:MAG: prepilin-type N-terminal cleavage/methylation domain-containing protein [Acidobacteria bacterium]|nr:prepilin-type N-terminal cleavage/methylation domain-containing protein [Acidobacteriota bacterium]MCW5949083.1 prepilin-type N-terminal cleavage/methylation domain-containing protein [Pyrinomonadaceae bacterium]